MVLSTGGLCRREVPGVHRTTSRRAPRAAGAAPAPGAERVEVAGRVPRRGAVDGRARAGSGRHGRAADGHPRRRSLAHQHRSRRARFDPAHRRRVGPGAAAQHRGRTAAHRHQRRRRGPGSDRGAALHHRAGGLAVRGAARRTRAGHRRRVRRQGARGAVLARPRAASGFRSVGRRDPSRQQAGKARPAAHRGDLRLDARARGAAQRRRGDGDRPP